MISKRKKTLKLSLTRHKLAERAEKLQKEKELEAAKIEGDNNDEDIDDDNGANKTMMSKPIRCVATL